MASAAKKIRLQLEQLESRDCPTGGVLDPTFGTTGMVTTALPNRTEGFSDVAVYRNAGTANDGKIVAVGQSNNLAKTSLQGDVLLVRYNSDGSLDNTFGSKGVVVTDFNLKGGSSEGASSVAIQADGKIVVAGSTVFTVKGSSGFEYESYVARYNANGTLDTTFNKSGEVFFNFWSVGHTEGFNDVLVQPDGKIVAAGRNQLVRLTSAGNLDATFTVSGTVYLSSVALTSSGQYVVAGEDNFQTAVWRYNADGTLDNTFGTNGEFVSAFYDNLNPGIPLQVTVLGDNSILGVTAKFEAYPTPQEPDVVVFKLTPAGALDTSFNGTGFAQQNVTYNTYYNLKLGQYVTVPTTDEGWRIAVQSDGKILVGATSYAPADQSPGSSPNKSYSVVLRYNADGTLDTTYGSGGTGIVLNDVVTSGSDYNDGIALALQPDGKVLVAGVNRSANDAALLRYTYTSVVGPEIGSFTANPNPVTAGSNTTLTVSNITDGNAGSTITQVTFYDYDSTGNKVTLGTGTQTSSGVWTFTFTVTPISGTYTLYAQAEDSNSVFGDPVAFTLTVE